MQTANIFAAAAMLCASASASVIAVGESAFPDNSTVINFQGIPLGTEVNGLVVNGVTFSYSVGGQPLNGAVAIGNTPVTNNISPPDILSVGNASGILSIQLSAPVFLLGYGYAIFSSGTLPNATTISVFSGTAPLGTLPYTGTSDPFFTGGFAGIQSTIAFDRVQLTFLSGETQGFALDNLQFPSQSPPGVPEPSTVWLLIIGVALLGVSRPRSRSGRQSDSECPAKARP
jgi:PEP-CTERM motif